MLKIYLVLNYKWNQIDDSIVFIWSTKFLVFTTFCQFITFYHGRKIKITMDFYENFTNLCDHLLPGWWMLLKLSIDILKYYFLPQGESL